MRSLILVSAGAVALMLMTVAGFSMGSGGGGSSGGGYGNSSSVDSGATYDDYTVALRLIKHEQYSEAIPHLGLALADHPHSADILNYLGYTHRMVGDYQSSLDYYKRALAEDPNHKGVHEYLGELYLQMHDQPSAQKELETLASLCPSGCDERDTLSKAIAAYTPAAPATGQTSSAATPATQ